MIKINKKLKYVGLVSSIILLNSVPGFTASNYYSTYQSIAGVPGTLSGIVSSKTGPYTIGNNDRGNTIALGGNAFYTLTVNDPSTYTDGDKFYFLVINTDSGRGKGISINGANYIIWPGQSRLIYVNGTGSWSANGGFSQRWRLSDATTNFYSDITNGSDLNDCLAPGAGNACRSVGGWLSNIVNSQLDFNGSLTTEASIVLNMVGTDTTFIHWSPHPGAPGAQGDASITIDGGGSATLAGDGVANSVIQLFDSGVLRVQNITIAPSKSSSDCTEVSDHGIFVLGTGVTFNCGGNGILADKGGRAYLGSSSFTIAGLGASSYMLVASDGGVIDHDGGTVTLGSNIAAGGYANASRSSVIFTTGVTYNLNGHTFTGLKGSAYATSYIYGMNAMFGSGAGFTSGGASDLYPQQVSAGYTGATSFTNHGIIYGQGGGQLGVTGSANSSILVTDGSGIPSLSTSTPLIKVSPGYTVATLPTPGVAGRRAFVTDQLTSCPALNATFTGGGSKVCAAFDNGTAWVSD